MYAAIRGRGWGLALEVVCLSVPRVSLLILAISTKSMGCKSFSVTLRVTNRLSPTTAVSSTTINNTAASLLVLKMNVTLIRSDLLLLGTLLHRLLY